MSRIKCRKDENVEAAAMNFQKNLSMLNISTNYSSQLSFYDYNIHVLSNQCSSFYTYDETAGKKGADSVCFMLSYFINTYLSNSFGHLIMFCNSYAGQSENYIVFHFLCVHSNIIDKI